MGGWPPIILRLTPQEDALQTVRQHPVLGSILQIETACSAVHIHGQLWQRTLERDAVSGSSHVSVM